MICSRCGSKEFEELPLEKGKQKRCIKCGFVGNPMSDLT